MVRRVMSLLVKRQSVKNILYIMKRQPNHRNWDTSNQNNENLSSLFPSESAQSRTYCRPWASFDANSPVNGRRLAKDFVSKHKPS